ncbi:MAG: type IV pilin N-terminal domain-containing protein [Methanospirillum sp.]|uniref:type IV pilin N-terminal domain-containing protein n=1 Tax=Methanospirillum sp. TaxID=45200 RepID=UPI002369860F|nr:type IV pilin N-terminal domain-containing protein [Methanospirillum sp.]MDD1728772.1 type IV pilin N-terminal domain-containing protein [Methanospirillum sp.]
MKTENGISEIVGVILLVAIVIVGIGIVGVFLFSTAPPQSKEKAVLSSSCLDCNGSSFVIVIRHEGGDSLDPQKFIYWIRTEYSNGTPFERIRAYGTWFYTGEKFAGLSRDEICFPNNTSDNSYNSSTSMKNGDAVVIWYGMKNSTN